jgi:precorrin-2 dehydrogenase/sirohydrochlorin ferrochelatase
MKVYPVSLRIEGRRCVVIGGGEVATRKVASLIAAGARVTVVSPALSDDLQARVERGEVAHVARSYRRGDLHGARLAFAAAGDEQAHAAMAEEAEEHGVLLNVADRPRWCTFLAPSVMSRGELTVAVSTGGASPALARRVREQIEDALGPQYERALLLLGRLRDYLREREPRAEERGRIFSGLVRSELLELLRRPDAGAVDRLLSRHVGAGVSLARLGVTFAAGAAARQGRSAPE